MSGVRARGFAATHPGLKRRINEDRFCSRPDLGLWAVADGMGGHAHGDWASNAVVQALEAIDLPGDFHEATRTVADAVHSANRRIWAEAQRRTQQMGSTVVALLVRGGCFSAIWVGDSRAYVLRDGVLHPLTRDHSQVQEMVDRGLISPEEARDHPRGHVLARAVGVGARLAVDVVTDDALPGDLFLLCSDGLTATTDDAAIAAAMALPDRQAALDRLVASALAGGAPDNVTIVLVAVEEATALSLGRGAA
ncbi:MULTISPECIES: PP2C family protein-serine/threonine phosphatase [unclassified Sphingomonas]|uniref:PP2C family protein-serine/threonine phosphatase n=1 Tax=unclassified Sphingomonas TaxID=196159 RepID=UPI0007016E5B|nr:MULTISPECIES: protein phosphatase 2C domain-containing protein [unclassified Sphingomonas]KQM27595.1 serine/threonine protein phosphatase [Sphingomonas sp. Leaf9]KQM43935.1 serine/threonine protein phosphatase [Sphingomonas sp. Leaf11]